MERAQIKILFLANWKRSRQKVDSNYAFFTHFEKPPVIRFLGTFDIPLLTRIEKTFFKFYVVQAVVAFFLSFRYDLVIAYSTQCALPLACLYRLFFRKKPRIIAFDVETFGRPTGGLKLALTRFAVKAIFHVVYASKGQAQFYEKHLPMVLKKCTHIPVGIGRYDKKISFEKTRGSAYIAAIGKHDRRFRDWKTLLLAQTKIADRIDLHIIGRDEISSEDRGGVAIPRSVSLYPYVPIAKLAAQVEGARFVVLPLPERNHSLGQLSILFCMAMGKAVIASRVIGVTDYLEPQVTGLFYSPGDPDDLAKCITKLLDDPDLAVAMGKKARSAVLEKFNDVLMGGRWESVVDDALKYGADDGGH